MENSKSMWIDTHAHIDKLKSSPEEVLKQAEQVGVYRILTIGTEREDWELIVSLCEKHAPQVYGALGMHPHTAKEFTEECEKFLKEHLSLKRIVALGKLAWIIFISIRIFKNKKRFLKDKCL